MEVPYGAEVRSGNRKSCEISDYLVFLSQAKVGSEARPVITFLLVMMAVMVVLMVVVVMLAAAT